jgi:signal transduction histidine kinase
MAVLQKRPSYRVLFWRWLTAPPADDAVQQQHSALMQMLLLTLILIIVSMLLLAINQMSSTLDILVYVFALALSVGTLLLLRQGQFVRAIPIFTVGLLVLATMRLLMAGVHNSGLIPLAYLFPIVLVGLLGQRRLLWRVAGLSGALVLGVAILEQQRVPWVAFAPLPNPPVGLALSYLLMLLPLVVLFDRVGATLSAALSAAQQEAARLEQQVRARTATLEQTLHELDAAKRTAESANHLKTQFLTNMSHELRTPLNAILNFGYYLDQEGPLNPAQADLQQRLLMNAEHLLILLNDVLDLAKVEAGHLALQRRATDVVALLRSIQPTAVGLTLDKGLEVALDLPPALPAVWIDPVRIRQVLLNLLSNAVKYTDRGRITIRAAQLDPEFVVVAVQDTGLGIAAEHHARIFETFQQVCDGEGRYVRGTGLGLPISRQLIELHGGRLWLESALGSGATFSFTLPILLDGSHAASSEALEVP